MIVDSLHNAARYFGIHPRLDTALRFLLSEEARSIGPGRHVLEENAVTCARIEAQTHPPEAGFFEAHRQFLDIHAPLSGQETLLYAPIARLAPDGEYDEAADCRKFCGRHTAALLLQPGDFAVCFPGDGHMPLICEDAPGRVEKLIFKVRL